MPTAIITGAASGIGNATARKFLNEGYDVFALDINEPGIKELAREFSAVTPIAVDLADPEAVDELPERCPALQSVDVLCNIAGFLIPDFYHTFKTKDAVRALNCMALAPMQLGRMVLPSMYDRGEGRIINIASIYGRQGGAIKSAYSLAKHANVAYTTSLAQECAERGVVVTCLCPGHVESALLEKQFASEEDLLQLPRGSRVRPLRRQLPADRFIQDWEVSDAVFYYATTRSTAYNGAVIPMDTGWVDGQMV
jgi:3-hydroxybutyrate dehydrogenase